MRKSFTHRLLVTLALSGIFFQMLYPLVPTYRVYAEDTVVIEENSSSSSIEKIAETSSSSSESSITSSESSSSSFEVVVESSSTESTLNSSSSDSSVSSSSSSSEPSQSSSSSESLVFVSSSASSTISIIEESVVSESSSSSVANDLTPVINPDTVISTVVPDLNEIVDVTLVESNKSNNVLEDLFPFLFTDKSDYAPTESAVISGKGFSPNGIYSVTVSSSDNPETTTTHNVIASSEGTFTYVYQLDGTYRPNYKVEVKDMSGEVVATTSFTDSDTTYKAPTSSSGSWSNASNAFVDGGGEASDNDGDRETYYNFGYSISAGNIITGIEVQADTRSNDRCQLEVDLSWNGGSSWTSEKSTGNLGNSETTKTLGASNDTWGRTWATTDFTNSNFRLRVQNGKSGNACGDNDYTYLDFIRAKVTYISNVAPVITEGTSTNVEMSQNGVPTAFSLTLNATDADVPIQTLTWNISSNGNHGDATVSGSGNSKSISYVPDDNYTGTDSFTVRVSDPYGLVDTIVVNVNVNAVTNPLLTSACGNDIALVIDTSLSTSNSELTQSKTALIGIVNALSGTPNRFSVTKFSTNATVVQAFTSNTTDVINAINSVSLSYGFTNISEGLSTARSSFDPRADKPNLMIVVTDGNPTWPPFSGLTSAINEANLTKGYPIRIVTFGIGGSINVNNLKAISGPSVGTSSGSDVVTSNFSTYASSLGNFISQTCGTITVIKDSSPDDPQDFTFNASNGLTPSTFVLDDDPTDQTYLNSQTFNNLVEGTYSFTEDSVSGWTQTSSTCTNQSPASAVVLTPGQTVTCTFVNTKKAHLIVDKVTLPSGDPQIFSFTTKGEGYVGFSLSDQSEPNDQLLEPGTYSVQETRPSGWLLDEVSCSNEQSYREITLNPGDTVTCTFTNIKNGHLIVQKTTLPSSDPTVFSIDINGTGKSYGEDPTVTDQNDYNFEVTPGTFSITENSVEGWVKTSNTCQNVVVGPGETKYCELVNTKLSSIRIVKNATVNSLDNFVFNSTLGNFTLDDDEGVVGADDIYLNSKLFTNVTPGEYSFSEINPSILWSLRDVICIEGENTPYTLFTTNQTGMVLTLPAGKNITCTFNNVLGSVLGVTDPGTVLAVTGDNSIYAQLLGLFVMLGAFGVLVISKTRKKYSK